MFERLGQVLIDAGVITAGDANVARGQASAGGQTLDRVLVALGITDEETIARTLADAASVEFTRTITQPPEAVVRRVAAQFARMNLVLPLAVEGGLATVAMADPLDLETRIAVTAAMGSPVQPVCATRAAIESALDAVYGSVPRPETASRTARLLVVDDSATMRGVIASALSEAGWDVREVKDGVEAWASLLESAPDAIVTDWNMPRLDGIGLVRRIKCHPTFARIPVLMLTSNEDTTSELQGLGCGADDYLGKSADTSVIVARVRRLLAPRGGVGRAA